MLRTYGDVSYKQEQRFHLELGLLKLVHAQRLLPLEQLLSESSLPSGNRSGASASPSRAPAAPSRTLGTTGGTAAAPVPALLTMTSRSGRLRSDSTAHAEASGKAGDE